MAMGSDAPLKRLRNLRLSRPGPDHPPRVTGPGEPTKRGREMGTVDTKEIEALRDKVARYESPLGWLELQSRDCRRAQGQGEFREPRRYSYRDENGAWVQG